MASTTRWSSTSDHGRWGGDDDHNTRSTIVLLFVL
jgi:hypothetical protein